MWGRFSGRSESSKDRDEEKRKSGSSSTRRKGSESVVSSSSSRRPSRRESQPRPPESVASSYATFATARDGREEMRSNADLYDDPRDDDRRRRRRDVDERSTYSRRERSRSRDRSDRDRKKDKDRDKDRDRDRDKREKRKSKSEAGGSRPQEIVDSPREGTRSVSGQPENGAMVPYSSSSGPPMMSGALPAGTMSSHVQAQFPGQDPAQFAAPFMPGRPGHTDSFGEAAEYYGDMGESVQHQPGVRPDAPAVIMPLDTPHLVAASAQANPVPDTGSGAAADFYGTSNFDAPPTKPPRPSSMPGAFTDDEPLPQKPPRPSSKPGKPGKISSAATLAGAAGLGYAMGHSSSHEQQTSYTQHTQHSTSYTNGSHGASANMYYNGDGAPMAATDGSLPNYSDAMGGVPPQKPPRPGKPEKRPSDSSHAGLYAAGAAGLAAYGLAHHNSNSHSHHNHTSSMPGGFPSDQHGGHPSGAFMSGGMVHVHEHKGPVTKLADWWKNHDDVRKMEEYTEYIGVCRGCFDPRSSPMDAPRKHHYNRKRSSEFRPSGIPEKQSRYGLSEKASRLSLSGDERRDKRKSSSAAGWGAAVLGGVGLASVGKALLNQRDDFDDTYSVKSGRGAHTRVSRRSRSRSHSDDRKRHSSGRSEIRERSRSHDRYSRLSTGVTRERKDYKIVRHRSSSGSRSRSRDRKSGILGAALGAGIAASAVSAARRKHRSRSRSKSPQKVFVHRRDSSDHDRRYSKTQRVTRKSSRSSAGSFIDVSRTERPQGSQSGFFSGFFAAPPPKPKRKKSQTHLKKQKKKKGFFSFGNDSTSSSGSELAFGTGYVKRKQRPSRRSSDEKLNATLLGLGATAAAITAAKAGRSKGKHRPEIVAVRERRDHRRSSELRRPHHSSRYGSENGDGWEDLPDDETSDSGSVSSGLAFGDYDWKKGKSTESLASNGSGTSKWGWRWGSKKQKKKSSSESLYNTGPNTSFVGPAAVGAAAGAAIGAGLHRHDSNASSSQSTLQSVYPVASNDPNSFDARRTSALPTPQPLVTSRPDAGLQQPQPLQQVPGAIYATQGPPQPGYVVPSGPPVFSQHTAQQSYPFQQHHADIDVPPPQPPRPRRANSSPIQSSSWKRDAAIAGVAAGAVGAAALAARRRDEPPSNASNVRFDFTPEQAKKEGLPHWDRESDSERRRRKDEDERREQERRRKELQRQQDEARRHLEAERLAKLEAEQREAERRRDLDERRAREVREAEEQARREREARVEAQRKIALEAQAEQMRRERRDAELREAERYANLEREAEQMRRERQEAERREAERREAAERRELEIKADIAQQRREREAAEKRESEMKADAERRRREREAEEYSRRYESDRDRRAIEPQPTGSSVASDVRRKERELEERERDIVHPDTWKSTAATAAVAGAAAAITSAAISSSKRDERDERKVRTVSPPVKEIAPSQIAQDYAEEEIFDRDLFKKKPGPPRSTDYERHDNVPEVGSAYSVLQDWEDRYKEGPVSQADFFTPKELLEHSAPSPKIDPNEGATDLHIYQAHDDLNIGPPKVPPYPPSYSFTATRDGRGPSSLWPTTVIPTLNLIQPTPPGSRANSIRGVSLPPSPAIEPQPDPKEEPPKQEEVNRRGSRVSWGENQFHNYEVPTPDSYRESFVSDRDLQKHSKQSQDEVIVQSDSDKQTTSYRPQQEPEYPSSTQFVPDQEEDGWAGTMSKKASKKDRKKAKAAAAAAGAAVATAAIMSKDDKSDTFSTVSDPFADKYAASSVVSSIPSTSSVYQSPHYDSVEDVAAMPSKPKGLIGEEITAEPAPIHIPGSFDEDPAPSPPAEEWAPTPKKGKKGKKGKKSKSIDDDFPPQESPKAASPTIVAMPDPESFKQPAAEPEYKLSKKDKKNKKGWGLEDDYSTTDTSKAIEPLSTPEPEYEQSQESFSQPEQPAEDEWAAPIKKGKKDKKGKKSKGADEDFSAQDVPKAFEPEPTRDPEPTKSPSPEPVYTLSKKDRKKKAKAAKRSSTDNWDESESSQPGSPAPEREVHESEPSYVAYSPPKRSEPSDDGGINIDSTRAGGSSSSTATAALAGGFAGLVASAMKQDQDRMAADLAHAREYMKSANTYSATNESVSTSNGNRSWDEPEPRVTIPSTAFGEFDELADNVKTPKKKKRLSSGRWSPSVGSPLRSEVLHDDYIGAPLEHTVSKDEASLPKSADDVAHEQAPAERSVHDSGYYAPDDQPPAEVVERDSDEFFSAGSEDRKKSKVKSPSSDKYEYRDTGSSSKYDDDLDREDRPYRRHDERSVSRDRGYAFDDREGDGERKRRHRRRETDDFDDEWDNKSTISESRSEANGERRRKHKRRESERNGSPEDYRPRSSAASEPGDLYERRSSRRRSKRDGDDDNMSVVSSSGRYDDERSSPKKDKEKRSSGLFGLFSKSKESLVESSSKSSRSRTQDEDEDEERRRRRKKKGRGSTYGSDDDDARSVVSTSSRRSEKRRSTRDDERRKV